MTKKQIRELEAREASREERIRKDLYTRIEKETRAKEEADKRPLAALEKKFAQQHEAHK